MTKNQKTDQFIREFQTHSGPVKYYSLEAIEKITGVPVQGMPYSIKLLLENIVRNISTGITSLADLDALSSWSPSRIPRREIPYMPGRVVLQDFTGVPTIVDLAAMRDAMEKLGGDPQAVNPVVRSDLVIDHSVQVDYFGKSDAINLNVEREFQRNGERYQLFKWAQNAFNNLRVVPPGTGIVHQVNLEYLASVVLTAETPDGHITFPDTCVGTDSHTTMVNGIGVLGWGVGGIEAEAVMLGQPYYMLIPEVTGVHLRGQLREGVTATDLVLTITETLRKKGVVEKFVEFFGQGLDQLPITDRATISNMAPEYGATCGLFPVDDQTLRYLRTTGRDNQEIDLVERYFKEQGLFRNELVHHNEYSETVEFDLREVETSLAGPKRPQDRTKLVSVSKSFYDAFPSAKQKTELTGERKTNPENQSEFPSDITHGAVVIAAITSCTNTSNPSVMLGAGLLARNALARGLKSKPWVKTSMAPGSQVVSSYLEQAGLMDSLNSLGFGVVGFGCTTCIGNSGPLPQEVADTIDDHQLIVAAVLSGNRNFEGRIHPQVMANYLASPMLVVAYALAGKININLETDPIGTDFSEKDVYLRDIWPSQKEISEMVEQYVKPDLFQKRYSDIFRGDERWDQLTTFSGNLFPWDPGSTYVQPVPFFDGIKREPKKIANIESGRVLVYLGDSVTTDHISPAGSIGQTSPAGRFLSGSDVPRREFNTYGTRRGNQNVMVRGTFGNIRLRNQIAPGTEGDWTVHFPTGEILRIFEAAERYRNEETPLIVIAGREYGTGSSRDWAAKGPMLLGVKAVIAQSFERIHRSNLVGMGVLPLQFQEENNPQTLGLSGEETYDIAGIETDMEPGSTLEVIATNDTGGTKSFSVTVRIDTAIEMEYFRHGGLLNYVLRKLLKWT